MCGRFCCALNSDEIRNELYQENVLRNVDTEWVNEGDHQSSYNVCPTRSIPTVLAKGPNQTKIMQSMKWGFIPSWLSRPPYNKPINARTETLLEEKSMFDKSKNIYRCVIAAEGFFEWNKKKQAFFVRRKDKKMMLFAGLYSISTIDSKTVTTCTIITTEASQFFSSIHRRMPVILEPKDVDAWINNRTHWSGAIIKLLKPFQGELDCFRVSENVGSTKNDTPELIKSLDEQKSSISHFLKPADIKDEMNKNLVTLNPVTEKMAHSPTLTKKSESQPASTNRKRKQSVSDSLVTSKTPKITNFFTKM